MVIELKGQAEATVLRMAEASGLTRSEVVAQELAHSSWQEDAEEQAVLAERIADADRQDFVPDGEMHAKFLAMLRPR